jgi:transposase InsO family protein
MAGFVPRKRRVTTTADRTHRIPDLLKGDFGATTPDEAWVGDISYIRTRQGFLYLAFVLDLASRRVVGVSMAPHLKASLATDALREAIATRGGHVQGVVFHTDRGSQYTSDATAQLCRAYGIRQSVGRTGVCWDNAAAESFLGTLKKELVNRADYRNRRQARLSIRWWIEAWYNPRRLHSTIGQQPPNEWEDNYYHHTAA